MGIWLCSLYSRADSEALAAPAVPYWDGRGLVPCRSSTTVQAARLTSQVFMVQYQSSGEMRRGGRQFHLSQ